MRKLLTRNKVLIFFGLITIGSLAFGAFSFGKILTDRKIPSIDERLEFLKQHQSMKNSYDRVELVKRYGATRRPAITLNFAAASDCESLLDSAEFYLGEATNLVNTAPDREPKSVMESGSRSDREFLDFATFVAVRMTDAYDDCLGNP